MLSSFKQNHPIVWRVGLIVIPFAAGIAAYLTVAAAAPSYPQSIRKHVEANLQPLRDLPIVVRFWGPQSSTEPASPVDTLMKHYAALKSEPIQTEIVSDTEPVNGAQTPDFENRESGRVTWNTTNTADPEVSTPLDMGSELDGPLYHLAESTDADARIRAIEALSETSDRQAVRACVEGLTDLDPVVRRHAARAIARADREILYREWIHILQHGPGDLLQAFDAALPELQDRLESAALAGLASGTSDRIHKLAAIYTLGRIRSEAALPLLAGYAWSGDLEIGQTATAALAEIRSPQAVGALSDLTEHYDADVRWYATNGLGILKGQDALTVLEGIITSGLEPLPDIRTLAIGYLGEAKDAGSIPALIDALRRYPGLRYDAMYALEQITGIQELDAPFQWETWYDEWSMTDEAKAALRSRRQVPATQVAVMPVQTPMPQPPAPAAPQPRPTASAPEVAQAMDPIPAAEELTAPNPPIDVPDVPEPAPRKPLQVKRTSGGGSFGTTDLSPAELMRQGGFDRAKP